MENNLLPTTKEQKNHKKLLYSYHVAAQFLRRKEKAFLCLVMFYELVGTNFIVFFDVFKIYWHFYSLIKFTPLQKMLSKYQLPFFSFKISSSCGGDSICSVLESISSSKDSLLVYRTGGFKS
jgi:hypothetical protein